MGVTQIVNNLFSFADVANYFNNNAVVVDAVNAASLQLYLQNRDKFGVDQAATDYLQEMYGVYTQSVANPLVVDSTPGSATIDVVKIIEVQYVADGPWYAVKEFSPNEWNLAITNPVTPPRIARQGIYSQLITNWTYDILPAGYIGARVRALTLPVVAAFTFVDNPTPIPTVVVTTDLNWAPDKDMKLTFMTMMNVALNVNSDALYKFAVAQAALTP